MDMGKESIQEEALCLWLEVNKKCKHTCFSQIVQNLSSLKNIFFTSQYTKQRATTQNTRKCLHILWMGLTVWYKLQVLGGGCLHSPWGWQFLNRCKYSSCDGQQRVWQLCWPCPASIQVIGQSKAADDHDLRLSQWSHIWAHGCPLIKCFEII